MNWDPVKNVAFKMAGTLVIGLGVLLAVFIGAALFETCYAAMTAPVGMGGNEPYRSVAMDTTMDADPIPTAAVVEEPDPSELVCPSPPLVCEGEDED